MAPITLVQAVVSGALVGCLYTLIALGFALVLGVTRALNLAHGELVVLGGYAGYAVWLALGLHPLLLVPVAAGAVLPLAIVFQWLLERLPPPVQLNSLVLTFGLSLLLQNGMSAFWSGEYRLIASPSFTSSVELAGIVLNQGRVLVALIALVVVLALWLGLTRTRWGWAVRATSLDRDAAALLGIDVDRSTRLALFAALALAGGAGVLFATIHYLYSTAGGDLTLLAITLTIWAGIGRVRPLLVAGIVLGLVEALTIAVGGSGWREPAVALLLLGSLLARGGALGRSIGQS
ncbi:MAG: branched-chain amino acid ABC transporter permease [Candidatus Rokubacteria bacterium]|nr:branched-chain amino acid ABC transporter permease [Candidatus Rokubacteria bacterium]